MSALVNVLSAIGAGIIFAGLALFTFDVYRRFRQADHRRQIEFGALTLILAGIAVVALTGVDP